MIISKFFRTLARRWRHERGAVLVEAAIAIPILLLLILGSIEAGMAWNAKSSTTSGLRSGLLRAATLGDEPETDLRVLQSVVGEVGSDNVSRLDYVMIYDASANGGNQQATISACELNAGTPGECVFYPTAVLETVSTTNDSFAFHQANFDQGSGVLNAAPFYTCSPGLDSQWCAASRPFQADGSRADVQIGVALRYQHEWFTGIFPGDAPVFRDDGVSSTFQEDGAQIDANTTFTGPTAAVAYSNDFNGLTGGSGNLTSVGGVITDESGSGRTLLGLFDRSTNPSKSQNPAPVLSVSVDNLPVHTRICIEFDLVIFGGWEEAGDPFMPTGPEDVVWVTVNNANTTGSSQAPAEVFRGTYDADDLASSSFAYMNADTGVSAVVPVSRCVDHVADDAQFDFRSIVTAALTDESWAIENLSIRTV